MKKLSILLIPILFAFNDTSIKLKKEKVDQVKVILVNVFQYIDKSNLPHQEVIQLQEQIRVALANLSDTINKK